MSGDMMLKLWIGLMLATVAAIVFDNLFKGDRR